MDINNRETASEKNDMNKNNNVYKFLKQYQKANFENSNAIKNNKSCRINNVNISKFKNIEQIVIQQYENKPDQQKTNLLYKLKDLNDQNLQFPKKKLEKDEKKMKKINDNNKHFISNEPINNRKSNISAGK